jgi:hypothetical protein
MAVGWAGRGVILAIAAASAAYVISFHYPAPYYDEWDLAPLLEAWDRGDLRLGDLFIIHGGHWHGAAYALLLPLARLTHWSQLVEALLSLAFIAATCALLLHIASRFMRDAAPEARLTPLAIVAAYLTFSLDQSGNMLWGFQVSVFVSVFGAALCLAALLADRLNFIAFALALIGLGVSVGSYATGFALIPVGLALIAARPEIGAPARVGYLVVWASCGAVLSFAFLEAQRVAPFGGGFDPGTLTTPAFAAYLAQFELVYLGAAIARLTTSLIIPVAVLGLVFVAASTFLAARRGVSFRALATPLALCAFGIGAGLLCGLGRFDLGAGQGGNGRYFSFSNFFWLGVAMLAFALIAQTKLKVTRGVLIAVLSLLALLKVASGVQSAVKATRLPGEIAAVADTMRADPANAVEASRAIAWDRQDMQTHVNFIREKRWSVYR